MRRSGRRGPTWTGSWRRRGPAGTPSRGSPPGGCTRCSPRPGRSTGPPPIRSCSTCSTASCGTTSSAPQPHPTVVVNTMWPLDEFTADNGATRFVPGSHEWAPGRTPAAGDPVLSATMSPGSAMLYLGSLWHGGGANHTGRPRLGVILEYAAAWLRPQENHCLAVPRAVVRQLPGRLQELLGYGIYPPFLGYVDGRHPRRVLSAPE